MGKKTTSSQQAVTIPPEVLARYSDVNNMASAAAAKPFQQYSSDPSAFVAPINSTQTAGIANTNAAAGQAQPYYDAATGQLINAQNSAAPYYNAATGQLGQAQTTGAGLANVALGSLQGAQNAANPLQGAAGQNISGALNNAQPFNAASAGLYGAGLAGAQPYNANAGADFNAAYGNAQPYNAAAGSQYYSGLAAAQPFNDAAGANYGAAYSNAQPFNSAAVSQYYGALGAAQPLNTAANQNIADAQSSASPFNTSAANLYGTGLAAAQPFNAAASQGISGAQASANPLNASASGLYGTGLAAAQPFNAAASQGISGAQAGSQPYQYGATALALAGAQGVDPSQLSSQAIGQYLSPYLQTVLGNTSNLINQNNQQAMAGQTGNAIRQGAFGGDRAGIAAANLQQQQNLAAGNIYSGILNTGYNNALQTAQQQQGVNLSAAQANRSALQNAATQIQGIGQQGFGQGITAAQAQQGLGQQVYGQATGTGQAQAALGQQVFGQGLSAAQAQQGVGQQIYGQATGTGQAQAALGQQVLGQGLSVAQQQAALAQQQYAQQTGTGSAIQGLGAQQFGQGVALGQAQQGLGQQQYAQQTGTGTALQGLGQQNYAQGLGLGTAQQGLGNQVYGQATGTAQGVGALGNQVYGQQTGTGAAQAALGNQEFGQGATVAGQQAALGQQQFGQGALTAEQLSALGQSIYGTGASTAQSLASLGAGAQSANLSGAQAQLAAGQVAQQTQQAGLQALYNQFLQQQSYPFQTAQFAANIAEGTGANSGSTTTTTQPGGFFSDKRLKEDIEPIGKTFDGQNIVKFRYKGSDKRKQIGLLAQDVEQKHPDAVGLAAGYKTVDYDKATQKAAARGHFAEGGSAGFDPQMMAQILQNAQGMYGPYTASVAGGRASPEGGPYGGSARVPAANLPVGELRTAGPLPSRQSPAENAKAIADLASNKQVIDMADWLKAKFNPQGISDNSDQPDDYRRGGLAYADGGMPYQQQVPSGLDIPDDVPQKGDSLQTPGKLPKQTSDFSKLLDVAKLVALTTAGVKSGGRIGYADGGLLDDAPWYEKPIQDKGGLLDILGGKIGDIARNYDTSQAKRATDRANGPVYQSHGQYFDPSGFGVTPGPNAQISSGEMGLTGMHSIGPAVSLSKPSVAAPPVAAPVKAPVRRVSHPVAPAAGLAAASPPAFANMPPAAPVGLAAPTPAAPQGGDPVYFGDEEGPGGPAPINPNTINPAALPPSPVGDAVAAGHDPTLLERAQHVVSGLGDKLGHTGFVEGLKRGDQQSVVPLLAAIAAAGTAPTRHLGVALASGLGAGTQAYTGTQQELAKLAQTRAATGQIGANTFEQMQAHAPPNTVALPGPDPHDPAKTIMVSGNPYHYGLAVNQIDFGTPNAQNAPPSAPREHTLTVNYGAGGIPTFAPTDATLGVLQQQLGGKGYVPGDTRANAIRIGANDPAFAAAEVADTDQAKTRAADQQSFETNQRQMAELATSINSMAGQNGVMATGAWAARRADAVNGYETLRQIFGLAPDALQANVVENQVAEKVSQLVAAQLAHANGERAAQIQVALSHVLPGMHLQTDAAAQVLAPMMIANQQGRDFPSYWQQYANGAKGAGFSYGVNQAFARDTNPVYNQEQAVLRHLLDTPGALQNLDFSTPAKIKAFEDQYGVGSSRYFR